MLSGIGDPDDLRPHGIAMRVPLKEVGNNLRDHTAVPIVYRRKSSGPFQKNMRFDRISRALGQAYFLGTGFASDVPIGVTAFLKTHPDEKVPNVQMHFWMGATAAAAPYFPPFKRAF